MTTKEAYQFLKERSKAIKGTTYFIAVDEDEKKTIYSALIQVFETANHGAYIGFVKTMEEIKNEQ